MIINQKAFLMPDSRDGHRVYRLDANQNSRPDAAEPILVRSEGDAWKPVETLERSIDRCQLARGFALWRDREHVTRTPAGIFWDRVTTTPADGQVQGDELTRFQFRQTESGGVFSGSEYYAGGEIVVGADVAVLNEYVYREDGVSFKPWGPDPEEKKAADFRANTENWMVKEQG